MAAFAFSKEWKVLGPFQIGTREATWGADPLELHGGFRSLEYDDQAVFKSSLAPNGSVVWSNVDATLSTSTDFYAGADLHVAFPDNDWQSLRDIYGWAALQWQAWARGEIIVESEGEQTLSLNTPSILEYWIDGIHYFGGDYFEYRRASTLTRLNPGVHRIDVRLVRDVRAMGGVTDPAVDVKLELTASNAALPINLKIQQPVLISDVVGSDADAVLASPYAAVTVTNEGARDAYITTIQATHNACLAELLEEDAIKIVPGQTRPVAFRLACVSPISQAPLFGQIQLDFAYRTKEEDEAHTISVAAVPRVRDIHETHKVTFMHPGGIVSYAMLRPPSSRVVHEVGSHKKLPIMLVLHGAGVNAEEDEAAGLMDALPDLRAWVVFPSGVTSWCGDDWHSWGFADTESAIGAISQWAYQAKWEGPSADIEKWLVAGHSNGGQGVWYLLTHWPDKVIAAAPVSGYSSIQNYVPYTLWHAADPGRAAVVEGALTSFRHELLLANAANIPVLQQHGSADDNVPVFHSRLLSQLIREAGAASEYVELPGQPHWWEGIMTTKPLADFYERQLASATTDRIPSDIDIRYVAASPLETGSKYGFEILALVNPGQLGKIHLKSDSSKETCFVQLENVRAFRVPQYFHGECRYIVLNGKTISEWPAVSSKLRFTETNGTWEIVPDLEEQAIPGSWPRQLGHHPTTMDAILRSSGSFQIVRHSVAASHVALQISRNLCQYYAADTEITDDFAKAFKKAGNIISVAIGDDFPASVLGDFPIWFERNYIVIPDDKGLRATYYHIEGLGLGAVFLRPLSHAGARRLELVVWGVDEASLDVAARLVPMMTGVGQPGFVVMDRSMLWKGIDGALAMGFFDANWNVSRSSFLKGP